MEDIYDIIFPKNEYEDGVKHATNLFKEFLIENFYQKRKFITGTRVVSDYKTIDEMMEDFNKKMEE